MFRVFSRIGPADAGGHICYPQPAPTMFTATRQPPEGKFLFRGTSGEEARMTERTEPAGSGDERSLLDGWLDY